MSDIWAGDISTSFMLKVGLGVGIPFLVLLIIWAVINSKIVRWRPFTDLKTVFSLLIAHNYSAFIGSIFAVSWVIYYFIPFVLSIIFGIIMFIKFSPSIFGLIFILVIPPFIAIFAIIKSYSKNGYKITWEMIFGLIFFYIALVITPFVYLFKLPTLSWVGAGYLFSWPPILVFCFLIVCRRRHIKDVKSMHPAEVGSFEDENDTAFGSDDKFKWYDIIIYLIISIACALIFTFIFWKKEEKAASYATAIMFFGLDILILVVYTSTKNNILSISLAILALVLKSVAVTFTKNYWFIGHGIIFFFLIIVTFAKLIFDNWSFSKYDSYQIRCEQIIDNLILMNHGQRSITIKDLIFEYVAVVILIIAAIVDGVLTRNSNFPTVLNGLSQQNLTLILEIIAVCIGFGAGGLLIVYQREGHVGKSAYSLLAVSIILAIALSAGVPCFYDAITLRATFSPLFVSILSASVILIVSLMNLRLSLINSCSSTCQSQAYDMEITMLVASIFWFVSTPLIIILPFVIKGCGYWTMILAALLTGIIFYTYFFVVTVKSDLISGAILHLITSIVLFILFAVGIGFVSKWYYGLVAGLIILFIICSLYGIAYHISEQWINPFIPFLYILIPSAIIAIASLIYLILKDEVVLPCVILFAAIAVFFGALTYCFKRKADKISVGAIISLIVMTILLLADIIYLGVKLDKGFLALTVICLILFVVSFVLTIILLLQGATLTYSSVFYPVRAYYENELHPTPLINFVFAFDEVLPLLWGVFANVLFNHPEYGFAAASVSLALIPCINLLLIAISDGKTNFTVKYSPNRLLEDTLNTVRGIGSFNGADAIDFVLEEMSSLKDYTDMKNKEIMYKQAEYDQVWMFKSRISQVSEVEFTYIRNFLYQKYARISDLSYLLQDQNWSVDERKEIFQIYDEVKKQDAAEEAARLYYEQLANQARLRIQNRNQLENDDQNSLANILGGELLQAENNLKDLKSQIRNKEAERYKRQKELEIAKQKLINQRIEEDRRRRQEEEELKKTKDAQEREQRRQRAQERKRQEAERRRREDEEMQRKQEEEDRKRREEEEALRKLKEEQDKLKQINRSAYTKAVASLEARNQKFEDPAWYPKKTRPENTKICSLLSEATWNRLEQNNPSIIDPINGAAFKQGNLGDCYLVAALSALAEDPKIIEKIFEKPIVNKANISCVNINRMGKVDKVIVDSVVPCRQHSGNPIFVHFDKQENAYWPAIIEKAFAKYFGSYSAIAGGCSHIA
ncbi:calcium-dependent cysteine-type endopeptidase protein, partial [Trichomonas vaginalis G3]|uniref:calcium-dependent cysteine-type endopeptidase protein n=1 Tax=Trichomonas vaginalis (strain ATCC PRA-98 / G3) TaxID=412133 RepID=UPI0021E53F93